MKIHSISLRNVRAVEHLELDDIPDTGVMLLHGDNEAGKSTVLDAIDAVLNFKHSTSDSRVKVLAPAGKDVGPEITLRATVGPYTFSVRKVFLRKKRSELTITAPKREQFTGREADDKLEAILDEHLDKTLAATLFLRQGELDPGIAAAGIPSITRALDTGEAGSDEAAPGTEDTALMQRIEAEYLRFFTAKGRKNAAYADLEKRVESASASVAELDAEVARLSGFVDEVARKETEIARISAELPEAVEQEATRAEEAAAAKALADKAEAAQQAKDRAEIDLERATEDIAARAAARSRVDALTAEAAELSASLVTAREAAEGEQARVVELTGARDRGKERLAQARADVKDAEAARQQVRGRIRAAELGEIIARLDAADKELADLRAAQPEKPVTDADVRAVETAREELGLQRRLRDTASAKLEITAPEGSVLSVDGDVVDFEGTATVGVHHGTRVGIGDVDVVYRGAQGTEQAAEAVESAQRELSELLDAHGCDDIDALRSLRDTHAELAGELTMAQRRREDVLGARDAEELRAEHARLAALVEGDAVVGELGEDEAEAALSAAQRELDEASDALELAEGALRPWAERKEATALAVLEERAEAKTAEKDAAVASLAAAEEKTPTEQLETARERAAVALDAAKKQAEVLAAELKRADPELAADLLEGAQVKVRNLRNRLGEAERRVAELSGRIEQAAGVAEQADRAASALEAAESELATTTRRAEAAQLLRETMLRHRDEARARYAAPFAEALNRYATRVFGPDVEFTLGESLEIQARTLHGATVALDQLSGGAKEQLALLVRFAIAELAGTGQAGKSPVPVIVDDALGATDPTRLELMNSLFNQVGRESQVFVLTCFPQRFDRVSVAKVASISELKQVGE
ncbi:AAA family ATPase [Corynebacterium sanguinis]|uniref:AAA family ATPase n=1 Tax=Corynebacterium sanguinis TaxID=2594913 RepID=UPI00223AAD88|nr:AAA family ATPase [Corynebacterium sanguinis]MCT1412770.1 AAA family ATPase [Corynebacterium sanguinis]MCT1665057.1 AAA family ATPase [Corynebacterium sanguinis]MCT2153813.1 AAA family ATPase [Corynebacterium sanguinis]